MRPDKAVTDGYWNFLDIILSAFFASACLFLTLYMASQSHDSAEKVDYSGFFQANDTLK